jgi:hypothetical protein
MPWRCDCPISTLKLTTVLLIVSLVSCTSTKASAPVSKENVPSRPSQLESVPVN